MMRRTALLTAMLAASWTATARADECEALAANVHAQNPEISVADRSTQDQSIVVTLKNPDVEELTLTCATGNADQPPELTARAKATWPSSNFYDVVASAGAIAAASTTAAIRSGSVLCAQRAMTSPDNSAIYDINNMRFACTTTTGVGGETRIRISKFKAAAPQEPSPQ